MVRRLIFLVMIGVAVMATLVTSASAQDSPGPTVAPTTIVREVATTAPPETVGGVTVRPLPRTGDDFGIQVMVGAGLTAAGLAFAVSARLRRHRVGIHANS